MVMTVVGVLAVGMFHVLSFSIGNNALAASPGANQSQTGPARFPVPREPDNPNRSLAPYFTKVTSPTKTPDPNGFLQRWLLLEPIPNGLRTNVGFTEAFVRNAFYKDYYVGPFDLVPKEGDKVTINDQDFIWHALDSTTWNVKVFRFAYGLNKPTYGVTFWAVTVVESPREMKNVRLAVGSNSASIWWLNGQEAVVLFGDRRMVMDDCVSKRLTLKKGRNVIRGAIINGPGLSDFCVRFIDENGNPVKDLTLILDSSK
ncbi:MAG: hypothetical protein QHH07_01935 [Sedimentisphaerales bacterium]|nr:hypothetical protein [Sedimentisphaerales bacterium]